MEYITSPFIDLFISVTSSGRSSINNTISSISGLFTEILFAIFFNNVVLPTFGGATIIPLCPFPIGHIKSIILIEYSSGVVSSLILSLGYIGIKSSNFTLLYAFSGASPLTSPTYIRAGNFSPSLGNRAIPLILSPLSNLNLLIWIGEI